MRNGEWHSAKELRAFIKEPNREGSIRLYQRPSAVASLLYTLLAWFLMISSWYSTVRVSWWLAILALPLIGIQQRVLGNIVHDGSHRNLFRSEAFNDLFATAFAAMPLFVDFDQYRQLHIRHHAYLGHPDKDPDFLVGPARAARYPKLKFYLFFLLDFKTWKSSAFSELPKMNARQRLASALWWSAVFAALGILVGWTESMLFLVLWFVARFSTYHCIKVFAEVSDHTGVSTASASTLMRTMPDNFFAMVTHAHNDNFHLAHHLLPRVPMPRLGNLHATFLAWKAYQAAQVVDGYFFGTHSLTTDWLSPKSFLLPPTPAVRDPAEPARVGQTG